MTPLDPDTPHPLTPTGGDDDIIELTEAVDEAPAEAADLATTEVVLEFSPGSDLSALKAPAEPPAERAAPRPASFGSISPEPAALEPAPSEESLDDFLSSLSELSPDLDLTDETPLAPPPAAPGPDQEVVSGLAERLSDEELREMVRQVVQETVERLAREIVPEIAAQAIDRELARWKKRLSETD